MTTMRIYIYRLLLLLLPLIGLGSCNDDDLLKGTLSLEGNVPVEFSFNKPSDVLGTRGTENYKQEFENGDVIHITGEFVGENGATNSAYGAMKYTNRTWVPIEGATLYWPYDAVKGTFTAYYSPESDYALAANGNSSTPNVSLSDIQDAQDPLKAVSKTLLYGYKVELNFKHACTYLTLEKMESNVTDFYWMVFPQNTADIKNAYRLTRTGGKVELEFVSVPDVNENDLVYISRPSENYTEVDSLGQTQRYSRASFYLAPGNYNYFDLRTNSNFPFMSFLNSLTEELLENHPYTLNVENAKGASFEHTTQVDWDENGGAWKIDVKEFLQHVNEGTEYTVKDVYEHDVPILKKGNNGTLLLMENLDFDNFSDYNYDEWGFFPDIKAGTILNGNLHYIQNIGHPVFRYNFGTIENLGLRDFNATVTAYEGDGAGLDGSYSNDFSRMGGLCCWNRSDARIENVRLENFTFNVKVKAENPAETTHNENYSFGMLAGDNYGFVSDIALKGNFEITVDALDSEGDYSYVDAAVNIGGILGANSSYLTNVGPETEYTFSVTINNNCRGRENWGSGVFCLGGAIGNSTGNVISQIVINDVTINATDSDGYQQHIGGLVGRLRGNGYTISDCTVQGTLTSGTVSNYGTFYNSFSYVGGIAGNVRGYTVSNCRAVCNINANPDFKDDVVYATGGAFGRIQVDAFLYYNTALGTQLTGPANYIGNFAGIANDSYEWADLLRNGNTARAISSYDYIGTHMNDTSND